MNAALTIRPATPGDDDAIWRILEPAFRAGETYPIPRDISRAEALAYWRTPGQAVFVAEDGGTVVGTYYLRANQRGGGAHVCQLRLYRRRRAQTGAAWRGRCASIRLAGARAAALPPCNSISSSPPTSARCGCGSPVDSKSPAHFRSVFAHPARGLVDAHVMVRDAVKGYCAACSLAFAFERGEFHRRQLRCSRPRHFRPDARPSRCPGSAASPGCA